MFSTVFLELRSVYIFQECFVLSSPSITSCRTNSQRELLWRRKQRRSSTCYNEDCHSTLQLANHWQKKQPTPRGRISLNIPCQGKESLMSTTSHTNKHNRTAATWTSLQTRHSWGLSVSSRTLSRTVIVLRTNKKTTSCTGRQQLRPQLPRTSKSEPSTACHEETPVV